MTSPAGLALVWPSFEKERAAWALERAAWALEREASARLLEHEREASLREREAWAREREASLREREAWARERDLLVEREATAVAELKKQVDFSDGLITVRSVLEGIVTSAFPSKSATEALRYYCDRPDFQAYLATVSAASDFSTSSLIKSAKGAYGMLSQTIHGGSTYTTDATAVPQTVLHGKCTLRAVAAIFKFERRDVRFYVGGPSGVLKLPSPPRSASHSAVSSAASSPPRGTGPAIAAGGGSTDSAIAVATAAVPVTAADTH